MENFHRGGVDNGSLLLLLENLVMRMLNYKFIACFKHLKKYKKYLLYYGRFQND